MSSFYDDASLVVIPSGYKTSKVYAEKPTDGSGDLAFTRTGDTATRVNSAGLIEKVRTNLLTRSQEFDNAAWTKDRTTVTANATTAPDGTATADKVVDTLQGANAYRIYNGVTLSAISYSASFYVKAAEYSWVYIRIGNSLRVWFNVSTGVVGNNDSGITGVIQSAGNGWYRCTAIIATATAGGGFSLLGLTNANGIETYTPSTGGQGVFVWGAQLETTDFGATPYIPTTTAAVSVGPVANVPRLDYLGSTCPRLLLEPQRTNLALYSEQFNNAAWTKTLDGQVTITANTAVSPDGTTSADKMIPSAIAGFHCVQQQVSLSAGSASISVFAKAAEYSFLQIFDALTTEYVNFNLTNGTVGSSDTYVGTIDSLGNGWYRCKATKTVPTGTFSARIGVVTSASAPRGQSFTGNGTNGLFIWGAQLEASYATSYIPTLAASATRGADACSKTGISSLIGQTEGTLYAEIVRTTSTATDGFWVGVNAGTVTDWIFFGIEATRARFYVRVNNVVVAEIYPTMGVGTHKMALGYKSGQIVGYIDGVQVFSSTATFTLTSLTKFQIGATSPSTDTTLTTAAVKQALLFKTRLTNTELATLTTL